MVLVLFLIGMLAISGIINLNGILVILAISAILLFYFSDKKSKKESTERSRQLEKHEEYLKGKGFKIDKTVSIRDYKLYVDNTNKCWCFFQMNNKYIYKHSDILGFEIYENGNTVTSGATSGAIAGGLMFGATGAVVGATTGKSKDICTSLQVRIQMNDLHSPEVVIDLIKEPVQRDTPVYTSCISDAKTLISNLTYIKNNP